ncbi:hypothetical protein [Reichenbachiella sp. MSK19-1]|uniref:hypothetical protein n=1 Tax=Reichenbachiella sp. MSK19-1 TaxID=1897631 RepID=UPI00131428EC|nr:hypothetical protein [Reichenbachiella sp. MSK19-1]
MKVLKAAFVAFALLTLVSACSQEEELVLPTIDLQDTEGVVGDREDGETPPLQD